MPRVNWRIDRDTIDDFDRDSQFTPYRGPQPPGGAVYQWRVTENVKSVAGTRDKFPQLRVGLELVPRKGMDESKYKGYYITAFLPISEKTAFRYVPFLDAIGVSSSDFIDRTVVDEDGKVTKIGRWRNDGKTLILGQLRDKADQNGNPSKEIGWMGSADNEELDDDDSDEELFDDQPEEKPRGRQRQQSSRSRRSSREGPPDDDVYENNVENMRDDLFGEDEDDDEPRGGSRQSSRSRSGNRSSSSRQTRSRRSRDDEEDDPF